MTSPSTSDATSSHPTQESVADPESTALQAEPPQTEAYQSESAEKSSEASLIKRGLLVITAAKIWFILSGLILVFGLPYLFSHLYGAREGQILYGQYTHINNTLSILSMVLVTGGLQTVSKWVSQYQDDPPRLQGSIWQVAQMMLALGAVFAGGFALSAPWLAQGRAELFWGYRLGAGVLLCYALYGVIIGTLNGRKRFVEQAGFDILFATLKVGLILGGVLLGLKINGVFGGFALATVVILLISLWKVGLGPRGALNERRALYVFAGAIMLYTLIFNMIFKLDLLMLNAISMQWFGADQTDQLEAIYGMNLHASRLPWQITIAATFVIFPLLSKATFENDRERSLTYIKQTLRYLMILVGVASAGLVALPQAVSGVLPPSYAEVAQVLVWCGPAYFFFTLFNLNNTLLMSAGRAVDAMLIAALTLGVVWLLYTLFLPTPTGVEGEVKPERILLLIRISQASLIAFLFGFLCGVVRLTQLFGFPLSLPTSIRVLISAGVMYGVAQLVTTQSRVLLLVALVGLAVIYFVTLTLLREWDADDRTRLGRFFKRA